MQKIIVKWDSKETLIELTICKNKVKDNKEKKRFDDLIYSYSKLLANYVTRLYGLRDSLTDQAHDIYIYSYTLLAKYDYKKSNYKTYLVNKYKWMLLDSLKTRTGRDKRGIESMCWGDAGIDDVGESGEIIRRKKYDE